MFGFDIMDWCLCVYMKFEVYQVQFLRTITYEMFYTVGYEVSVKEKSTCWRVIDYFVSKDEVYMIAKWMCRLRLWSKMNNCNAYHF